MWETQGWWCFYSDKEVQQIEVAFTSDEAACTIVNENGTFTIDFKTMTQGSLANSYNRQVKRVAIL